MKKEVSIQKPVVRRKKASVFAKAMTDKKGRRDKAKGKRQKAKGRVSVHRHKVK